MYLITNKENLSQQFTWSENSHNKSLNENFDFKIYKSLKVACFMHAIYDGFKDPNIWLCQSYNEKDIGYLLSCNELISLKNIEFELPSQEQRINFAILCVLNVVKNPIFVDWAKLYLGNLDRTKEKAETTKKQLLSQLGTTESYYQEHCSSAITFLTGIIEEEYLFSTAATAHRAFHDSFDFSELKLDLEKMAAIASMLDSEQIYQFVK
jgi:hypothetical protein